MWGFWSASKKNLSSAVTRIPPLGGSLGLGAGYSGVRCIAQSVLAEVFASPTADPMRRLKPERLQYSPIQLGHLWLLRGFDHRWASNALQALYGDLPPIHRLPLELSLLLSKGTQ